MGTVDFDPGSGVDEHTSAGSNDVFLSKLDGSGNFLWALTWGSSGVYGDGGHGVSVDGSNNILVAGMFDGTADFDPGPSVDEHASAGNHDIFLSKFDGSGNFVRAQTWGGSEDDWGNGVALDGSGNSFVIGVFSGTADFDPGASLDEHVSIGDQDIFLSKFDSGGDFAWARTWGGTDPDTGTSVAADGSGNVYVTGFFRQTVDFDPGPGVDEHTPAVSQFDDVFLSKFDSGGNFIRALTWGGSFPDRGQGVAVDGYDNVYVAGTFAMTADFDPGPGEDSHTALGESDAFLSALDIDGNFLWARTWGGTSVDFATGVATDDIGDACATGSFYGTVDFDPGPGVDEHTCTAGEWDSYVDKFPPGGNW
jgi:hypothetical protein